LKVIGGCCLSGDYKNPHLCEYHHDRPKLRTSSRNQGVEATVVDRSAIFSTILARQALRRDAHLPLLDIGSEYRAAVAQALRAREQTLWQRYAELHHDRVRGEILARQRAKHGPEWPSSWGGRMALSILVQRALKASFRREHPSAAQSPMR
jgi:hypothetical protein